MYMLLGSFSGTNPGIGVHGVHVPLNPDLFTDFTAAYANSALLANTIGLLSPTGSAHAAFVVPPRVVPIELLGLRLDFASMVADPVTMRLRTATSTVPVTIGL
jgi:hypothetical protein